MKVNDEIKKDEPDGLSSHPDDNLDVSIIQWQGPRYKIWLKSIAIVVAGVFLFQQVAWAGDIRDLIGGEGSPKQTLDEVKETLQRQQELLGEMEIIEPLQEVLPAAEEEAEDVSVQELPIIGPEEPVIETEEIIKEPEKIIEAGEEEVVLKAEGEEVEEAKEVSIEEVPEKKEVEIEEEISPQEPPHEGEIESAPSVSESVYEEVEKIAPEVQPEVEAKIRIKEIGQKVVRTVILFLNKAINSTSETYSKFRGLLEKYNPQILAQEGFDSITSYLKSQIQTIVNCASFALGRMLKFADDLKIATTTIIVDILYGILVPKAKGLLKTSLFALKEAGKLLKNTTLYALDISIEQLKNIVIPVIAHIKDAHYVVVTKITDAFVTYVDNTGRFFKNTVPEFLKKWKGIILAKVKPEGAKGLTEEETKEILGAGEEYDDLGRLIHEELDNDRELPDGTVLPVGTVIDYTYVGDTEDLATKKITLPSGLIKNYTYAYYTSGTNKGKLQGITGIRSDGTSEYDRYSYYTNQPYEASHYSYIYYARNQGYEKDYEYHKYCDGTEVGYSITWSEEKARETGVRSESKTFYYPSLKLSSECYYCTDGTYASESYHENELLRYESEGDQNGYWSKSYYPSDQLQCYTVYDKVEHTYESYNCH